jgi:hypothetical protein
MTYYELQPAYGRDYASAEEVRAAFNNELDFLGDYNLGFAYINKQQFEGLRPCVVNLRYHMLQRVAVCKLD